jgi:hypothetical protein
MTLKRGPECRNLVCKIKLIDRIGNRNWPSGMPRSGDAKVFSSGCRNSAVLGWPRGGKPAVQARKVARCKGWRQLAWKVASFKQALCLVHDDAWASRKTGWSVQPYRSTGVATILRSPRHRNDQHSMFVCRASAQRGGKESDLGKMSLRLYPLGDLLAYGGISRVVG